VVHRRQKYSDSTSKETNQVSQAQTLMSYVEAGGQPPDSLLASRTSFTLAVWAQMTRSAKLVRDARRNCQSGSDRLENQSTDPAAAGRYGSCL
jgi:hypothetical protein